MSDASVCKTSPLPDFSQNYFHLFNLDKSYHVPLADLEKAYLALQRSAHPDRFASDSGSQLLAVKYTAFINDAYETLKSPLLRAQYLLRLSGVDVDFKNTTITERSFLIEQMELRDALSEVCEAEEPDVALEALIKTVEDRLAYLQQQFVVLWQQGGDKLCQAVTIVQKMYFLHKFLDEAEAEEDRMLDL